MSNASPFESDSSASLRRRVTAQPFQSVCLPAVRFVGFWTAVLLPFVLVSMLVTGLAGQSPSLVGGLLACNVAGLVLGRDYNS
ncbi:MULTISPECIES: hypothetical protein [Salinibaculum]|uniref:hypothetical protein n=1 Tax=Salinibaculum TaxID=2732368 RepID=UPI0030D1B259